MTEPSEQFAHIQEYNGRWKSICKNCWLTAALGDYPEKLADGEAKHQCFEVLVSPYDVAPSRTS